MSIDPRDAVQAVYDSGLPYTPENYRRALAGELRRNDPYNPDWYALPASAAPAAADEGAEDAPSHVCRLPLLRHWEVPPLAEPRLPHWYPPVFTGTPPGSRKRCLDCDLEWGLVDVGTGLTWLPTGDAPHA